MGFKTRKKTESKAWQEYTASLEKLLRISAKNQQPRLNSLHVLGLATSCKTPDEHLERVKKLLNWESTSNQAKFQKNQLALARDNWLEAHYLHRTIDQRYEAAEEAAHARAMAIIKPGQQYILESRDPDDPDAFVDVIFLEPENYVPVNMNSKANQ